ncbi:MAG: amidohydrolase family protein [Bacteroidota bacterium]
MAFSPIDAHQHFWTYVPEAFPWINDDMRILKQDFYPETLFREQARVGFEASIAVQARQSVAETQFLLDLAKHDPRIEGVVGWVDLQAEQVEEQLSGWSDNPHLVGVRHIVHDEPDEDWLLRPEVLRGLKALTPMGLTYDLLLFPQHISRAIQVVDQMPELTFVLDHIAKPPIKLGLLAPWEAEFRALAERPNVYCKLSGMVTEADWGSWETKDLDPYLHVAWEAFGEDRLMIGSDWPVCLLAGEYAEVMNVVLDFLTQFSGETSEKVLGNNCRNAYGLVGEGTGGLGNGG